MEIPTPAEVLSDAESKINKEVERMVIEIVKRIREDYDGKEIIVAASRSEAVFERVKKIFSKRGWRLVYQPDQRDGDFIRITAI